MSNEALKETVWVLYYEEPIHEIIGLYLFRTEKACKEFEEKTKNLFDVIHYEEIPIYSNYKEYEEDVYE